MNSASNCTLFTLLYSYLHNSTFYITWHLFLTKVSKYFDCASHQWLPRHHWKRYRWPYQGSECVKRKHQCLAIPCALFIPDPSNIRTSLIPRARLFAKGTEGTARSKGDKVSHSALSEQRREARDEARRRKESKEARGILVQCILVVPPRSADTARGQER